MHQMMLTNSKSKVLSDVPFSERTQNTDAHFKCLCSFWENSHKYEGVMQIR